MRRAAATATGLVALAFVFGLGLAGALAAEVCPEEGKVSSQVDGDLDDIVLPAGTLVCIKAGSEQSGGGLVTVEADGESTLAELIDNGHNVSHYTVLDNGTTTTLIEETTTTQSDEEPTTTQAETTTTTGAGETTTTTGAGETTTTQAGTTTTAGVSTTSKVTTSVGEAPDELPFTGLPVYVWAGLGLALTSVGLLIRRMAS